MLYMVRLRTRLVVGCVRLYNVTWVEIYPPSSVAYATASPQGEAFLQAFLRTA